MLTPEGRKRFAEVTRQNLHRRIAIVIEGKVYEAPVIQAELAGGVIPIHENLTAQQAADLAAKINTADKRK